MKEIKQNPRILIVTPEITYLPKGMGNIANYLTAKALRRHIPLPAGEIKSLTGLAVAKAVAYYDSQKATCSLRRWAYSQGWRLLLAEVRNELRSLRRLENSQKPHHSLARPTNIARKTPLNPRKHLTNLANLAILEVAKVANHRKYQASGSSR